LPHPPPQFAWGALQLKSPPVWATVAAHLTACGCHATDGEPLLSRWPHAPASLHPEAAYKAALQHVEGVWGGLSATQRHLLMGVPLVPVQAGATLVRPDTVYAQLGDAAGLAPFAFQLPSALLPHLELLSALGVREKPSPSDLLAHLTAVCHPTKVGSILSSFSRHLAV
jgi:sacsin